MKNCLLILFLFSFNAIATSQDLSPLINLKKGYKAHAYPNTKKKPVTFSILQPGFPLVPINGGVYIAGYKSWLLSPRYPAVYSAVENINSKDSSIIILKNSTYRKKVLIQRLRKISENDTISSMVNLSYGLYDVKSVNEKRFYIWGIDKKSTNLWSCDFKTLTPIFTTLSFIQDVEVINENNVLMAIDSSIVTVGLKQAPKELLKLDDFIDGIAIDKDGTAYVSTPKGVLHFTSLEEDDFDVITNKIHGKLRIFNNNLYILWLEANQVVEIKLR
jgi:hypothetical protein